MATKLSQCIVPPNRLASLLSWGPSVRYESSKRAQTCVDMLLCQWQFDTENFMRVPTARVDTHLFDAIRTQFSNLALCFFFFFSSSSTAPSWDWTSRTNE